MSPMPRIIGISGYARSGKDSFAAALVEGRGYELCSFAAAMKELLLKINPTLENGLPTSMAVDMIGEERLKDVSREYRRLQQAMGDHARRILGEDVWLDTAMRDVDPLLQGYASSFVFKDVRYHNEAQGIVDRGGIIVRIERDGVGPLNDHPSETEMDDWSFDYVVRNNWTVAELRQRAFDVLDKEQGKFSQQRYMAATNRVDGPWARDSIARQRIVTENGRTITLPEGTSLRTVDL